MARDYGRDARDWDYPGDGGHAYGRGREEGGYGRGYWSNVDREYGGRDFDRERGFGGSGGPAGSSPRGRWREFADTWRAQGEQWRDYENREHGRDYPRYASGYGGSGIERGYGEGRALSDYGRPRGESRDYYGDRGDFESRGGSDRYDRDVSDRDRQDRGGGRYGRYGNQERYDFTGRSWHAGPEHWEAEGPGPNAFQPPPVAPVPPRGYGSAGSSREWRGFGGEGYVGGAGGYGHGGALEYGRGAMDVGGRDQDWGVGETRHGSGGMGGRGNWFESSNRGPVTFGGAESGRSADENVGSSGHRSYAGFGPRNYRRSDERIQEEVCEALTRHPGIDASDVDIRVENGEVTLTGEVDDRRARRLAEEIAEHCSGVADVHNELRARRGLGAAFGGQDREVSRATTRETSGDKGTIGSTTGTSTGTTTGTTGGTTGGSTRGGRRGASPGMTSPDSTQTALRADTGEPDERARMGATGATGSSGSASGTMGDRNR